jgi:hypothetical protein
MMEMSRIAPIKLFSRIFFTSPSLRLFLFQIYSNTVLFLAEKENRIRTCVATGGEIFPRPKRDSSWINRND